MPKCPECKREISYLFLYELIGKKRKFFLDKQNDAEVNTITQLEDEDEYECPKCYAILFKDWDEAEKFLQGKEE